MDNGLQGKSAIVTGSGGGLGAAIAETLLSEGCNVVISDVRYSDELLSHIDELNNVYEARAIFVQADVSKEKQVEELFQAGLDAFGSIDFVVNNAGIWPTAYVREMTTESFRTTLDINLIGPFMLCRRMVNYCLDNGRKGKIVNMVSQAAFHGSTSGHAHYAASKAGLVGFTISLAREVAPYGIHVNAVAPGIMETPMIAKKLEDPVGRQQYLERIPLRRVATPKDVADIAVFLLSKQSDYMTGATLDASGGMLMR